MNRLIILLLTLVFIACNSRQNSISILQVPGKDQYSIIDENGISILASGRYVTPVGDKLRITHDPFGMAVSPDGSKAVTLHNGVFTVIDVASLESVRIPSYDGSIPSPLAKGSFLGVEFAQDSKTVYLSGGDTGAVIQYDVENLVKVDSISLNGMVDGKDYQDSFTSDLRINEAENELLVLDRGNFRLVRIDLDTKKIKGSVNVGRQPFGLAISPDKKQAFVANVGVYSYGDNTKESIEGTEVEGRKIPGLGSPLHPDAMSVFTIDLDNNKVIKKFKTGHQIGQTVEDAEVVGGASPNSIAVGKQFAYITNATNDNITIIDHLSQEIVGHIPIKVDPRIDKYRGLLPFGITMDKAEQGGENFVRGFVGIQCGGRHRHSLPNH